MKLIQINAVYGCGSTGKIVRDLHELSLREGIESYVAYSTTTETNITNGFKIGTVYDKKAHAILCRINGKQAYFSNHATRKLIKFLEDVRPDIVHLHNLHSNYINLNLLLGYLSKKNIRTVITLHDCWFYTGGCFHYTNSNCMRWKDNCGNCPRKKLDTPAYFFDKSRSIHSDRKKYFGQFSNLIVVGVSEWITNEAKKSLLGDFTCMTIKNGIDCDFFNYTCSKIKEEYDLNDQFVLLGMGNKWLDPINKDALQYFQNKMGNGMTFVIAGCSKIQNAYRDKGILYLPYSKNQDELRKIYSMADVFVNCTREESLSLVNVEAQACGTPVITYSNTGVKETVDGVSSFKVETGNCQELFRLVEMIKVQGKAVFSSRCRQYVVDHFSRETNYLKYIDLYNTLCK